MPENYRESGVYVEELSGDPAVVAPVETSTAAFIGYTEQARGVDGSDLSGTPTLVTSFAQYQQLFGTVPPRELSVEASRKGTQIRVRFVGRFDVPEPKRYLYHAVQSFFANGGRRAFIVSIGSAREPLEATRFTTGLDALRAVSEVELVAFPGAVALTASDLATVVHHALGLAAEQGRFVLCDVPQAHRGAAPAALGRQFRELITDDVARLRHGAAYFPYLETGFRLEIEPSRVSVRYRMGRKRGGDARVSRRLSLLKSHPRLYRSVVEFLAQHARVTVPPSGAVAGLYARVDEAHGAWVPPAGQALRLVRRPSIPLNDLEQAALYSHGSGKAVNAIRAFPGRGVLLWGARTLAAQEPDHRYVHVSRLAAFVKKSVERALLQFVFEPNDETTWAKIRTMVETFLTDLWRQGAIGGTTAERAFFVRMDSSTMTAADVEAGRMNVVVGLAVLRPDEFVLVRAELLAGV